MIAATAQRKPARGGLLDFMCAALALWAAAYHTPVGALARSGLAWMTGTRSSSRPLLAYYSAGVYDASPSARTPTVPLPPKRPASSGPLPSDEALAYGAWAAFHGLAPGAQANVLAEAKLDGISSQRLEDPGEGPLAMRKLLARLGKDVGAPDVALAALFCGREPALFARDRATADGRPPDLVALSDELPPGYGDAISAASQAAELGTAYALGWPVPESTRITSPFGYRIHPILGVKKMHTGVDLGVPEGTLVHATADGIVRRASEDGVNGKVIILDHGRGVTTAYCHNSELLVHVGDRVARGQVIAHSGTTGRSTGPHVHYQLDLGGTPTDPLAFRVDHAKIDATEMAAGD